MILTNPAAPNTGHVSEGMLPCAIYLSASILTAHLSPAKGTDVPVDCSNESEVHSSKIHWSGKSTMFLRLVLTLPSTNISPLDVPAGLSGHQRTTSATKPLNGKVRHENSIQRHYEPLSGTLMGFKACISIPDAKFTWPFNSCYFLN